MGTDSVKLFNKALSDQILTLSQLRITDFVEKNLNYLKQKEEKGGFVHSLIVLELKDRGGSIAETVERLIKNQNPLKQLSDYETRETLRYGVRQALKAIGESLFIHFSGFTHSSF